jgi:hypothetical protein
MKRLAPLLLALALGSCRENRASVVIEAICYPTADCTFSDKCDKVLIGSPRVNAGTAEVTLLLQISNQLADNSSVDTGRTNTNDAHVTQVVVSYGGMLARDVYNIGNQRVPTAGSTVIEVQAIRPSAENAATLTAAASVASFSMVAKIQLRGYYDDGSTFETGEFPVAIDVCDGCIAGCGAGELSCPVAGMEPSTCFTTK